MNHRAVAQKSESVPLLASFSFRFWLPNDMLQTNPSRPWYRMHWATWLLFFGEGGALAYLQFFWARSVFTAMRVKYARGVPREFTDWELSPYGPLNRIHWSSLVIDVVYWLVLLAGPLILFERLARLRFQFSLRLLLTLPVAIALVLYVLGNELPIPVRESADAAFIVSFPLAGICWATIILWLFQGILIVGYRAASRVLQTWKKKRAKRRQTAI